MVAMRVGMAIMRRSFAGLRTLLQRLPDLWTHRFFPGPMTEPISDNSEARLAGQPAPAPVRPLVYPLILVVVAGLLCFTQLDCALQEPEESLYAEVPRQMLMEGRLLVPVRHGQDYYDKPPLLYWLVMASYQVFGIHDWAARLVSAGAAFLCVLVAYGWGKRTVGARAAFAGALMLCLSPRFAQMARMLTTNSLLTLWVIAALAAAHVAITAPRLRRRWWFLSATACGLGLMTKGPVAFVLVAGPVLLYQFLDRRVARITRTQWLLYTLCAGGIALPWFIAVAVRDPYFIEYFVWIHHIRRFVDPIDHPQPFWYYLPLLLVGMLPWSLLLPWLLKHLASRTARPLPQRSGAVGFLLLSALVSFVFFSASGCKRPSYILPVMPPLALALGCSVDAACALGRIRLAHWGYAAAATFLILLTTAVFVLPRYADKYSLRTQVADQTERCTDDIPVLCFPHGWDGVYFYLQRSDVRVFRPTQLDAMVACLRDRRQGLVVVKCDTSLDHFLKALPPSLEFVPCAHQDPVAVGWVRER
jgi:4-amino-4-deoxy-L-arabinose transferase-like glycosyltransferase